MPYEAETRVNHYKFWQIAGETTVRIQVEDKEWETPLGCLEFLGNPTIKNETPIVDKTLHLTAYRIIRQQPPPRSTVSFTNQFGSATWQIGMSELLLVPAAKEIHPDAPKAPPVGGTHYVCYPVLQAPPIGAGAWLRDQFDERRGKKEFADRLTARYFALPATKNGEAPAIPDVFLAIYAIVPRDPIGDDTEANALDQFGSHHLVPVESVMLAVPSWKPQ